MLARPPPPVPLWAHSPLTQGTPGLLDHTGLDKTEALGTALRAAGQSSTMLSGLVGCFHDLCLTLLPLSMPFSTITYLF